MSEIKAIKGYLFKMGRDKATRKTSTFIALYLDVSKQPGLTWQVLVWLRTIFAICLRKWEKPNDVDYFSNVEKLNKCRKTKDE